MRMSIRRATDGPEGLTWEPGEVHFVRGADHEPERLMDYAQEWAEKFAAESPGDVFGIFEGYPIRSSRDTSPPEEPVAVVCVDPFGKEVAA